MYLLGLYVQILTKNLIFLVFLFGGFFFFFFLVSLVSCFKLHFVFSNDERMGTAMHTQERSRYS